MADERDPQLIWTEDGSPRSGRFGDVYFSREDGLAESRAVFLTGCGLPKAWAGRRRYSVAELGFGSGLNIIALLELWRRAGPAGGHLSIFSVEAYPLARAEAARALSAWPEIAPEAEALLSRWPPGVPGFHRIDLPKHRATLDLAVGEVAWALDQWSGPADAWFLDGFAPSVNPDMWSDGVLDRIAALSAPGARLATFTVAGAVRRGLSGRGFQVAKKPGHGRKRERLEARRDGRAVERDAPRVALIGAGIAGAALSGAFRRMGVEARVVDAAGPGAGASGFPAALVTPRLDAGDRGIAALHAQALSRAGALYADIADAVLQRGVLQLEQADRDAARFRRVALQPHWPPGAMRPLSPDECAEHLGEAVASGGLLMADALTLQPHRVLDAWLPTDVVARSVADVRRDGEIWRLLTEDGSVLIEADVVVLAAGWGSAALWPAFGLEPVLGQADWLSGPTTRATAWGGYVAPTAEGLLFGATHDRGRTEPRPSPDASERNLRTLAARAPRLAAQLAGSRTQSRAAVRATTRDRSPLAGAVPGAAGLHVLAGLGSRGFCLAPLLAEHVVAQVLGAPSPLPLDLAQRVIPSRWVRPQVERGDQSPPAAGGCA